METKTLHESLQRFLSRLGNSFHILLRTTNVTDDERRKENKEWGVTSKDHFIHHVAEQSLSHALEHELDVFSGDGAGEVGIDGVR